MSDEFLKKLYEMSDGEYIIFDRYDVGRIVGISNSQNDDIVDDLYNMGLLKKVGQNNVVLSFEGKQEVTRSKSN
jgi:Mn-dependent DtxR family transcriptional regulator